MKHVYLETYLETCINETCIRFIKKKRINEKICEMILYSIK